MLTIHFFEFSPIAENTYLLYNEAGDCLIIDPGCYSAAEERHLKTFIESTGLTPKQLLNTHCHLDHVFGNRFVHETWGLPLYIHPNEKMVLDFAPAAGERWNLPFRNYEGPLHFLKEGDLVRLGTDELRVIEAPGHSPGHICFYCEQQQFLIGGDVLFRSGIGRTDLPGGNHQQLLNSIREKLFTLPDGVRVYPGHGESTTIGYEKRSNPFL
ncbi:MAG TPA: MBL fold metallo-hydrolase [Flavihumibacter sp.]|jgi:hydroxyacylglutathione hydrolase